MKYKSILHRMIAADLKPRDFHMLAYLSTIADDEGKVECYRKQIAHATNTVGGTVTRSINRLIDAGIISPVRHGKSNKYSTRILP